MYRLDRKLARIRSGHYSRSDFIIADAKDGDMGPGITACGPKREKDGSWSRHYTRPEFLENIRSVVEQDIVDIMLTSASNLEVLTGMGVFRQSAVKPAIRANDTTDVWGFRGATYVRNPSRPFRTVSLPRITTGTLDPAPGAPIAGTNLGLYSITFNNHLEADLQSLEAFRVFREEAARNRFNYFLEVFNPNVPPGIAPEVCPYFLNDAIIRSLAGVTQADRPQFLKIPFNGAKPLEELAAYDPSLIVGVLGGGAGTTRDCFELLYQAERFGARVALFGRKINLAEDPLAMIVFMREVASGTLRPAEAVKAYHAHLEQEKITPARALKEDLIVTEPVLKAEQSA